MLCAESSRLTNPATQIFADTGKVQGDSRNFAWAPVTGTYPVFHILRGIARLRGAMLLATAISRPRDVQALAARRADGKTELWVANLTGEPIAVDIGRKFVGGRAVTLDEDRFVAAAGSAEFLDRVKSQVKSPQLTLPAYAVCRIIAG